MNLQDITTDASVSQQVTEPGGVEAVNQLLVQEIGATPAKGRWTITRDAHNRILVELHLSDAYHGEVTASFRPDELGEPYRDHLRLRFGEMKGALVIVSQWKQRIGQLFSQVETWCQTLTPRPYCQREPISIEERRSGRYSTERLTVSVGAASMRFRPVAAWIVGGQGRIDVEGPEGTVELVLDATGQWVLVTFDRHQPFVPFNQQEFQQLIGDLIPS